MWKLFIAAFMSQALGTECNFHIHRLENPEVEMNVSEVIEHWGYPAEEYEVETGDSYIITITRIPRGRRDNNMAAQRPVVFLQHGLLATSITWVSNLPNNSLAFILADAGFDVWLGNSRGSTYSLKHAYLPIDSKEYWAFSFDEMARYDLPASIDYIVKKTGQKIYYVGHSQGTLIGFLAFSTLPKMAQKVKTFFALAPIFTIRHVKSIPLRLIFSLRQPLFKFLMGEKDFLPETALNKILATTVCDNEITGVLCGKIIFSLTGFDPKNLNMSRIDVYVAHFPGGTSAQNILHYLQGFYESRPILHAFDWGSAKENFDHYNQTFPPKYNVSEMKVPIALWSGEKDLLADPKDVSELIPQIRSKIYHKTLPTYNHLDFIFGIDAPQDIYYEIIKMIKNTL
ncbi:gastric triacylglycerol lipase-like [Antechinus flavipes]|uniref:gastric triacylglycerol lipase-like n=1 Tax=Antechinus flavipes TaxID=38775 RepID=UPI002236663D|nr:gastric triacylglycerol lipase-like [Antechinus flavipes]